MRRQKRIPIFCVAAVVCVGSVVVEAQATLIAHYEFEGNYLDSSGNGHTGTTVGSGSITNDLERGLVYDNPGHPSYLDVDSTIEIPTLSANTGVTVAAWIKRDDTNLGEDGQYAAVIGLGTSGDNPIVLMAVRNSGAMQVYVEGDGGSDQVGMTGPSGAVSNEVWTHISVTLDRVNNIARMYVNGEQSGSDVDISAVGDGALNWSAAAVGGVGAFGGYSIYAGLIDDARIYYDVLSASEIAALKNGPPRGTILVVR